MPVVSIVVNNYNYGRFLREAVDSALAQTYGRVEVVVVDDGSTDGSRAIIASYGDRVTPVLKENGGQASALNAGFRACTGELVLFLDADDVLEPEAAAEVVAVATEAGDDVAKIHFPLRVVDQDGRQQGRLQPVDALGSGDLRGTVLRRGRYGSPPTSGNVFPRGVLDRLLPVPESAWRRYPDRYLVMLAPLLGPVAAIERPLGRYREHGENAWVMTRVEPARLREHLEVDRRTEALLGEWADRLGLGVPERWAERIPNHLQSRLGSLRLDPDRHPYPGDRVWRLALRGIRSSLGFGGFTPRKRLLFAGWFVLAAVLPARPAKRVIELGFVRQLRPAPLRTLTG